MAPAVVLDQYRYRVVKVQSSPGAPSCGVETMAGYLPAIQWSLAWESPHSTVRALHCNISVQTSAVHNIVDILLQYRTVQCMSVQYSTEQFNIV